MTTPHRQHTQMTVSPVASPFLRLAGVQVPWLHGPRARRTYDSSRLWPAAGSRDAKTAMYIPVHQIASTQQCTIANVAYTQTACQVACHTHETPRPPSVKQYCCGQSRICPILLWCAPQANLRAQCSPQALQHRGVPQGLLLAHAVHTQQQGACTRPKAAPHTTNRKHQHLGTRTRQLRHLPPKGSYVTAASCRRVHAQPAAVSCSWLLPAAGAWPAMAPLLALAAPNPSLLPAGILVTGCQLAVTSSTQRP
jgi:hypothetical protein